MTSAATPEGSLQLIWDDGESRRLTDALGRPFQAMKRQRGRRQVVAILWDPQRPTDPALPVADVDNALFGPTNSVRDYFLEVFGKSGDESRVDDRLTSRIQEDVVATVHANDEDASYRSLLLNATELLRIVAEAGRPVFVSLTAMPDLRATKSVGYSTVGYDDVGSIKLTPARLAKFIRPDRTVLVDLRLHRYQEDAVFRFSAL